MTKYAYVKNKHFCITNIVSIKRKKKNHRLSMQNIKNNAF